MHNERIEKSTHDFWMNTCAIDTYRRSTHHARHDTPWNGFSKEGILVCTLWLDEIVKVFDPHEGRIRQFIEIGGKGKAWRGPAVAHGREADENLRKASAEKLRVVGYEASPDAAALKKGERKVDFFYLDRAHELKRVFEFSSGEMLKRLKILEKIETARRASGREKIESGYLFELIDPKGDFPGEAKRIGARTEAIEVSVGDEGALFDELDEKDKLTLDERAIKALSILVEHVLHQKDEVLVPMTYKELAERLDRRNKNGEFWARGLGHVLGGVTALIDGLSADWAEDVPYLTTVVVSSQGPEKGLPGIGIRGKWQGYEKLTRSEKESKVMVEYQRILTFGSRWNDVLQLVELPPVLPPTSEKMPAGRKSGGWGGGESEEHKALKSFIKNNPHLVGADSASLAVEEYALRSADEIDVFFKSDELWIGVEVKSAISDGLERDYERGLYQIIKYAAVLTAQALVDKPDKPPVVKVLLALESKLPMKYRKVASALGVEVLENVRTSMSERPLNVEVG